MCGYVLTRVCGRGAAFRIREDGLIEYLGWMQIAIEWLVALCFLIGGVSHILQPRVWAEFFIHFRAKGAVGSFQLWLLYLPLALLIVAFHNIWHGLPLLVTLVGWAQLLKSLLYLWFPRHGLRMLSYVSVEKSWRFVVGGIFSVALGLLIAFSLATDSTMTRNTMFR